MRRVVFARAIKTGVQSLGLTKTSPALWLNHHSHFLNINPAAMYERQCINDREEE